VVGTKDRGQTGQTQKTQGGAALAETVAPSATFTPAKPCPDNEAERRKARQGRAVKHCAHGG
jgi:hypothetical protein